MDLNRHIQYSVSNKPSTHSDFRDCAYSSCEAHLVLKTEEKKSTTVGEPLPVKLIRMGRKYGFSIIVSTQLATDVSS